MRRSARSPHAVTRRKNVLGLERLEPRTMLAADMNCLEMGTAFHAAAVQAADAGSSPSSAADVGSITAPRQLAGSVGGFDFSDYIRFTLDAPARLETSLTGMRADLDLAIYNRDGQQLGLSNRSGSAEERIGLDLSAGTYYALVYPYRWAYSNYTLSLNPTFRDAPSPPPQPPADGNGSPSPIAALPDVPYYGGSNDWNINSVNAPEAWARGYTGQGVVVAVIDTGVDLSHPELTSQIWVNPGEIPNNGRDDDLNGFVDDVNGWDFVGNDNNPTDLNGHGTHVAGTIAAAKNDVGATGVAYGAEIMPVRVLNANGSGSDISVANGIRYAVQAGADIINLSLGGTFSTVIQSAIDFARQQNVFIVAASGNEGAGTPSYPARFSSTMTNVLSVGAYDANGQRANFSNAVGNSNSLQVDAPGVGVYSTLVGGRYATYSGTSMATPHVAGVAALALSANPNLTPVQLRNFLTAGATRTIVGSDSFGRINAALTVALAQASVSSAPVSSSASAVANSNVVLPSWITRIRYGIASASAPAPAIVTTPHNSMASNSSSDSDSSRHFQRDTEWFPIATTSPAVSDFDPLASVSLRDRVLTQWSDTDSESDEVDCIAHGLQAPKGGARLQ